MHLLSYTYQVGCESSETKWDLSSAGRASALQAEGHRFEPYRSHFRLQSYEYGEIAQLARAHGSYPWCRGFKSPSRYYCYIVKENVGKGFSGIFYCFRNKLTIIISVFAIFYQVCQFTFYCFYKMIVL